MSVGGVNPLEWILPPVALTHAVIDTAAQAVTGKEAFVTPGSATDKRQKAERAQQQRVNAAQSLAESRETQDPGPPTADDELASRRRARSASEFLTGRRRPSQTLAAEGSLGL